MGGRFALLYKNNQEFIAVNDACAHRNIYYGIIEGSQVFTSSPRMFLDFIGNELQTTDVIRDFARMVHQNENSNECAWYGDKSIDKRLRKVLSNHYLDITENSVHRIPINLSALIKEHDAIEYAATVLKGSMQAILNRYRVIQPLTAGWDSRTLLAAGKDIKDKIQYYILDFDQSGNGYGQPDVWVPSKLSSALGLRFQVIKPEPIKPEFKELFQREHIVPRMLKAVDIQHHYYHDAHDNICRVNGVAGAIIKSFYGYTNGHIDEKMLEYLTFYPYGSAYLKSEMTSWIRNAIQYAAESGISLLDLFHWEQKTGNWGALYAFEQDMAIEDYCPHANRNLLLSILRIHPRKRTEPKRKFIRSLIEHLWPETLSEPINPVGWGKKVRRLLKKNTTLRYMKMRVLSKLSAV
jgi:nitrite reductase/ring-hydroxylating ferredoxin subunit